MKRILGIVGLALLLTAGSGLSASAATSGPAVLKGHVRTATGAPIANLPITVGYFENGTTSTDGSYRYSHTDSHGRYEVSLPASHDVEIVFGGPSTTKYIVVAKTDFSVKAGTSYRIDRTLSRVSTIAGTVTDAAGSALDNARVVAYDATTDERMVPSATTNASGHYHLKLPGGSYKLRFSKGSISQWFGDEKTRVPSPTVKVTSGGKTAGINESLTR
jgi:hypothetical protein